MARSRWKLKYFSKSVWKDVFFADIYGYLRIRRKVYYHDRSSCIPDCFKGFDIRIHNGRFSRKLAILESHVSHKLGEFAFTRKPYHFPLKKQKKRKNIMIRK